MVFSSRWSVNLRLGAGLSDVGRLPGRRCEVAVAPAAAAALENSAGLVRGIHIRNDSVGILVADDGANGHLDDQILAPLAGAAVGGTVHAVFRLKLAVEAEIQQGVHIGVGIEVDVAAVAAVAAVRAAGLHELLAVEAQAAIAAVAGLAGDFHVVYEITHGLCLPPKMKGKG